MKKFLRAIFCDGKGNVFMPYVYAFIFIGIIVSAFMIRFIAPLGLYDKEKISDTLLLGLMAYSIALITVATWGKTRKDGASKLRRLEDKGNTIISDVKDTYDKVKETPGLEDKGKMIVSDVKDVYDKVKEIPEDVKGL